MNRPDKERLDEIRAAVEDGAYGDGVARDLLAEVAALTAERDAARMARVTDRNGDTISELTERAEHAEKERNAARPPLPPDAAICIYGVSDDLIEIDEVVGTVQGCDEFGYANAVVVCFPTEDVFRVKYGDEGVWCVTHERSSRMLAVKHVPIPARAEDPNEEEEEYTERMVVSGPIERVECWKAWPPDVHEVRQRVERHLDNGLSEEEVLRVWPVLAKT